MTCIGFVVSYTMNGFNGLTDNITWCYRESLELLYIIINGWNLSIFKHSRYIHVLKCHLVLYNSYEIYIYFVSSWEQC